MDNQSLQTVQGVLAKNDFVAVVVGKNPNLDEMGAALSFYLALKESGKQVLIACPTAPLVEISSLVGINKVTKSLSGEGADLIVAFPYEEGEIEKVSYTLENGFLNIIVKPSGDSLSFSEKDVQYKKSGSLPGALFIVGTPRLSDLGNIFDPEALKNVTIINIDNKADNQNFGDAVFVSPQFSSVSEQVASLIESLGLPLDIDAAQNLMQGIAFATENFQSPKTSALAFEMTAKLLQKGARRIEVSKRPEQPFVQREQKPFDQAPVRQAPVQSVQSQGEQGRQNRSNQPRQQFPKQQPRQQFPKPQNPFMPQYQPVQDFAQPQVQTQPAGQVQNPFQSVQNQPKAAVTDDIEIQKPDEIKDEKDAPPDWLTPKVYKGSTLV